MPVSRRILVTGPSWIGDMIMAQSLFKQLRANGCEQLDVLAPAWTHPLLQRMPEVDQAINFPARRGKLDLAMRWKLGRSLKDKGYDQAIVLPKTWKSALPSRAAAIPLRTGFKQEMRGWLLNDLRPLDKQRLKLMVQRYLVLGQAAAAEVPRDWPLPQLETNPAAAKSWLEHRGLKPQQAIAILAPGAEYGPAKRWPAEHFAALMRELQQRDYLVLLIGSNKDREIATQICALANSEQKFNLCGQTDLPQAIDLIAAAQLAVCNDSGLMHMAAACGTALIALYGSSSPDFTPPLATAGRVQILREALQCSPCFARTCRYEHYDCLQHITPQKVLNAIQILAP